MSETGTAFQERAQEIWERLEVGGEWSSLRGPFDPPPWMGYLLAEISLATLPESVQLVNARYAVAKDREAFDVQIVVLTDTRFIYVHFNSADAAEARSFGVEVVPRSAIASVRIKHAKSWFDSRQGSYRAPITGYPVAIAVKLADVEIDLELSVPRHEWSKEPTDPLALLLKTL